MSLSQNEAHWQFPGHIDSPEAMRASNHPLLVRYAAIYRSLAKDYPAIKEIVIQPKASEHSSFTASFHTPDKDNPRPMVMIASNDSLNYNDLFTTRESSIRETARLLNVDFEFLRSNPEVFGMFLLLHEFGHGYDFIFNYKASVKEWNTSRFNELAILPLEGQDTYDAYLSYQRGEITLEQFKQQEVAYRHIPSEEFADQFAADALDEYWDHLNLPPRPYFI